MKQSRMVEMYNYICTKERVSLDELQHQFHVSLNTVRRDIARLSKEGKINKIYGGVCAKNNYAHVVSYTERTHENENAKERICAIVGTLIDNGDTIFIDSGTTVSHLLHFLADKINVTIITHNVHLIYDALQYQYQNINVIALCGVLNRKAGCVTSNSAVKHLESMNIDKAFICASGIALDGSILNVVAYESDIKRQAISRSSHRYLLVDHSKFGKPALDTFAKVSDFDYIVTEKAPPPDYIHYFKHNDENHIHLLFDIEGAKWNQY